MTTVEWYIIIYYSCFAQPNSFTHKFEFIAEFNVGMPCMRDEKNGLNGLASSTMDHVHGMNVHGPWTVNNATKYPYKINIKCLVDKMHAIEEEFNYILCGFPNTK